MYLPKFQAPNKMHLKLLFKKAVQKKLVKLTPARSFFVPRFKVYTFLAPKYQRKSCTQYVGEIDSCSSHQLFKPKPQTLKIMKVRAIFVIICNNTTFSFAETLLLKKYGPFTTLCLLFGHLWLWKIWMSSVYNGQTKELTFLD
jgi:hypothetical protein